MASPCHTKIVCTIGPASSSEARLEEMIAAGMDVCRLNFSHGKHEQHRETFDRIRRLSEKHDNQVAILCDIQGPKIRTGTMEAPFDLKRGDTIRVTPQEGVVGNAKRIQISYATMLQDLDKNDVIFINDGIVKLVVTDKDDKDLICECASAGTISDHKGCNMPSGKLSVNVVTPKDSKDLEFIAKLNPEYVAASFVGTAQDVQKVRQRLAECGNTEIKIIAKIERPLALENIDAIIQASDALMVARGDLGVEIEAWDVPKWQKDMVRRCNRESRPVCIRVARQCIAGRWNVCMYVNTHSSSTFACLLDRLLLRRKCWRACAR